MPSREVPVMSQTTDGLQDLEGTIKDLPPAETHLFLDMKGRNPDDGLTDIAYEKGRFLLYTIEQTIGRERWDQFLNEYFKVHAFQSITTEKFLTYYDSVLVKRDKNIDEKVPSLYYYGYSICYRRRAGSSFWLE